MRLSPFSLKFPLSAGLRDLHASLSGRLAWRPKSSDAVQPLAQPPAVPPSQGPQSRRVPGVPAVMAVEQETDKRGKALAFPQNKSEEGRGGEEWGTRGGADY